MRLGKRCQHGHSITNRVTHKDEILETTVWKLYCLLPDIHNSLQSFKDYIQGTRVINLNRG